MLSFILLWVGCGIFNVTILIPIVAKLVDQEYDKDLFYCSILGLFSGFFMIMILSLIISVIIVVKLILMIPENVPEKFNAFMNKLWRI